MVYKRAHLLSPTDAAYLAGLIDGEGTVTLSRRNRYKQRGLIVTISNTERPLLEHVLETVGVGKITNKRIIKSHHTPSFTYQICNRQALAVLHQVVPFLRSHKAVRAALVLKDYLRLTPRNGRYSVALLDERDTFIRSFFAIQPRVDINGRLVLDATVAPNPIASAAPPSFASQAG